MKIYKIASNMQFIRGEDAEVLTKATGEAGTGYYFSPISNIKMVEYYTRNSKHVWLANPKSDCNIVDLTSDMHIEGIIKIVKKNSERMKKDYQYYKMPEINKGNYQRFPYAVEQYINDNLTGVDAYLIGHRGVGIPSGKQLVIKNLDAFNLEELR